MLDHRQLSPLVVIAPVTVLSCTCSPPQRTGAMVSSGVAKAQHLQTMELHLQKLDALHLVKSDIDFLQVLFNQCLR